MRYTESLLQKCYELYSITTFGIEVDDYVHAAQDLIECWKHSISLLLTTLTGYHVAPLDDEHLCLTCTVMEQHIPNEFMRYLDFVECVCRKSDYVLTEDAAKKFVEDTYPVIGNLLTELDDNSPYYQLLDTLPEDVVNTWQGTPMELVDKYKDKIHTVA